MAKAKATKKEKKQARSDKANSKKLGPAELAAMIDAKYGKNTLVLAKKAVGLIKPRFSTGSFALDVKTGGGSPEGAIELLMGGEGSGKSLGLLQRAGSFLKKHKNATFILINAEKTNDPDFLRLNGVDVNRTYFGEPESGEQGWDIIHDIAANAEKVYIGIDSLDAMVPLAELDGEMEDSHMAPAARQNNKGFRKLINLMKSDITTVDHRITMGIISQVRLNIGMMYGDPNQAVGGRGKDFAAMQILKTRKVKDLKTDGASLMEKSCYGVLLEVKVEKSKGRGQGETIQYAYYKENHEGFKRGEIDNITEMIPFALKYKLISKAGAWFEYKDSTGADRKIQGEVKLRKALAQDPDTVRVLKDFIIEKEEERHAFDTTMQPKASAVEEATPKQTKPKRAKRA